jgi:hypothetical protein
MASKASRASATQRRASIKRKGTGRSKERAASPAKNRAGAVLMFRNGRRLATSVATCRYLFRESTTTVWQRAS